MPRPHCRRDLPDRRSESRSGLRRVALGLASALVLPALVAADAGAEVDVRQSTWELEGRVVAKVKGSGKLAEPALATMIFGPEGLARAGNAFELTLEQPSNDAVFDGPYSVNRKGRVHIDVQPGQIEVEISELLEQIMGLDPGQTLSVTVQKSFRDKIKVKERDKSTPDDDTMSMRLKTRGLVTVTTPDEPDVTQRFKLRFNGRGGRVVEDDD